jgi:hypothetical protein
MRKTIYCFALALFAQLFCSSAFGDVHVTLKMAHVEFLQYEKMNAFVTIYNDENYVVTIDSTKTNRTDALRFNVSHNMKTPAVRINKLPLADYIQLKPGEKKTLMFDLSTWYSVSPVGSYAISAELEHGGRKWQSARQLVDVVDGIELSTVTRSLPTDPNRTRTYSIRYWSRARREGLFFRVEEEATGLVYGVYFLGALVRINKPAIRVDRKGNITIIHQSGASIFTKTTFTSEPYSVRFVDQIYLDAKGKQYVRKTK